MDYRQELIRLIRAKSYREGTFKLASGKTSAYYIDMKPTTLHPEGAYCIAKLAIETILQQGLKIQAVGGLTLGADPIATAISLVSREQGLGWPAFIVRKEPKDHGTARYIEGVENLAPQAPVLILEDVVTTGGSSLRAVERVKEAGYRPIAVMTVVDRDEGGASAFQNAGLKYLPLLTLAELKG